MPVGIKNMATITKKTVLVVEDESSVRNVLQRKLDQSGYKTVITEDGVEALDYLDDHNPDLILLDVVMPKMNGFDFLEHLHTIGKEKIVNISNLSLGGADAVNYQLMDTTASTKADISILTPPVNPPADIPMLTPAGYLQAIHFRLNQDQASNEPETKENMIVNVVDGAVNMTGITMLAGEH